MKRAGVMQALCSTEIVLEQGQAPEWIEVAKVGVWRGHPQVAVQEVTAEMLASALAFFERHYVPNGKDLVVDYHHASAFAPMVRAPAAAWIDRMELRDGGKQLWAHVGWLPEAAKDVRERRYRSLSPHLVWNGKDPVTGERVAMSIPDVALTNTPFMRELQSLNEAGGLAAGAEGTAEEGAAMKLIELLATALGITPAEAAVLLGVDAGAEDKDVAAAIKALAEAKVQLTAKVAELQGALDATKVELAAKAPVPAEVVNSLGLQAGADMGAVQLQITTLRGAQANAAAALGLADGASPQDVLNAIGTLQLGQRKNAAVELVDAAVKSGKVPPAARPFWLKAAERDLPSATEALNAMSAMMGDPLKRQADKGGERTLTPQQKKMADLAGVTDEEWLKANPA